MRKITDTHLHLRQGQMTKAIALYSAARCEYVIVMPNTIPPIHSYDEINFYKDYYQETLGNDCECHMTAMLLFETTPKDVERAKAAGAVGYKIYPAGATTNSHNGIPEGLLRNWSPSFRDTLYAIHDNDMVLMHHGELPSAEVMKREDAYAWYVFQKFLHSFKDFRMTFEHITTANTVELIKRFHDAGWKNLRATITLHHLENTLTDLLGDKLRNGLFCKPVMKYESDRQALIEAIKHSAFMFGSDSAPHTIQHKHEGCAGVFSAPILVEALYEFLEKENLLDYLDDFTWKRANRFYGFKDNIQEVKLVKEDWIVPETIVYLNHTVPVPITPYKTSETLKYRIK